MRIIQLGPSECRFSPEVKVGDAARYFEAKLLSEKKLRSLVVSVNVPERSEAVLMEESGERVYSCA
jgi:hypothetical protein